MSFAGSLVPSACRITLSRAGGAPGFADPSSLSRTAATIRIVAVARAVADVAEEGVEAVASAAAAIKNM
jgi:hypothetical protein